MSNVEQGMMNVEVGDDLQICGEYNIGETLNTA